MKKQMFARDLMRRDVETVSPHDNLREAINVMVDNRVSGLPVLDRKDRCVGILSTTDIVRLEQEQAERGDEEYEEEVGSYYDPDTQQWDSIRFAGSIDQIPEMEVSEAMSKEVVSVHPDTPLREVAEKMAAKSIHRILVLDDERQLHGIIAAMDFVSLYAESD
jgi:CBS domain-containing protein